MRCLDSITNSMDMTLSQLQEIMDNRGACHAAVHCVKSWTRLSDWTTTHPMMGVVLKERQEIWDSWTQAHQVSLSFTISQSLLKFMSFVLVMLSKHLILCCLLLLPSVFLSIRVFSKKNQLFASGGPSIGASASASVLPVNIQGWFPLRLTGLISLLSKGLSRIFFSTTVWKHQFFGLSLHNCTWLVEKP